MATSTGLCPACMPYTPSLMGSTRSSQSDISGYAPAYPVLPIKTPTRGVRVSLDFSEIQKEEQRSDRFSGSGNPLFNPFSLNSDTPEPDTKSASSDKLDLDAMLADINRKIAEIDAQEKAKKTDPSDNESEV